MTSTITKSIIAVTAVSLLFVFANLIQTPSTGFIQTAQAATTCGDCGTTPNPPVNPPVNPPNPPSCNISADVSVAKAGDSYTISWNGTPVNATFEVNNASVIASDSATYTFGANSMQERYVFTGQNGDGSCVAEVIVKKDVVPPVCDISASITAVQNIGDEYTISWNGTPEAASFQINNYAVADSGSATFAFVGPNKDSYTLTGYNEGATCEAVVEVTKTADPLPSCDSFTATPSVFGPNGGTATLAWGTTDATAVSIDNGVGVVAGDGSTDVSITGDITYTLTAENTAGSVTCAAPIIVEPPVPTTISCGANVTFNASTQYLPKGGGNVDFTWTTTGLDAVSFSGLNSTSLSGNESKNIGTSQEVTLIGTKNNQSISCPLPISVKTGGGHSSNPRCTLKISDDKVSRGQEVTLTWDTSRSKKVTIEDSFGNTLLDTENSNEFDGAMKLNPTKDTEYTLNALRGTKSRTCKVDVEIENTVTVLESRTLTPRVAGISLTQVPYTGFDATPAMTLIFYALLTIWGLFVAYVLVIRRDSVGGVSLAGSHDHVPFTDVSTDADPVTSDPIAEEYVDAVVASTATAQSTAPSNLPTAPVVPVPVIGYEATITDQEADESIAMTELENRAHAQKILLSSDAMRFFMNATQEAQRNEKLDALIAEAKETFPSEAGWVALNLTRMEALVETDGVEVLEKTNQETTPITGGSLAEAIIDGNIVAAYQMIENRPMIALADAATDLDAVYRSRKGEDVSVSNMLTTSAAALSTEKLEAAIAALTGAVDGTYDSEAQAVKMAIMKAVKAVA